MSDTKTMAERVAAGIKLLDEKVPGWRDKVIISELNMSSSVYCILGQVFRRGDDDNTWENGFGRGCKFLGLRGCSCCVDEFELASADYGFNVHLGEDFDPLQDEWERQLSLVTA